jgi:hypothetical protein
MGQYHDLCRLDKPQELEHYTLGAGAKALEQAGTTTMVAGLAIICATGFGKHPRDLPWAPKGTWAGKPLASVGDYAEDDDLLDHPVVGRSDATMEKAIYGRTNRNMATNLLPTIERACLIRSSGTGWTSMLGPIDQLADGSWGAVRTKGLAGCSDSDWAEHLAYMDRVDKTGAWKRAPTPIAGAPDRIPTLDEVGAGGTALWVSLDAREFVDTAALGAPDLAAVLEHGTGGAFVQSALFHNARRGGGDMDNAHGLHIVGRWRGDRIALVGPKGIRVDGAVLTQATIRATYADVTGLAKIADLLVNEGYSRAATAPDAPPSWASRAQQAVLAPFFARWVPEVGMDHPIVQGTILKVHPAVRITLGTETFTVPASAQLLHNGDGVIWLNAKVRARIAAALGELPPLEGTATVVPSPRGHGNDVQVDWPDAVQGRLLDGVNAHKLLAAYVVAA